MIVLAGLGNPGNNYIANRHNAGFLAVETIAQRYGCDFITQKFNGQLAECKIGTQKVLLFKPQSYMNESGQPIGELMRYYKLPPEQLYVFHDELALNPGKLRVKLGGGAAGHNGLKSIDRHIGQDYWRVRIGIGHPGHKDEVSNYVLSDFAKAEIPLLEKQLDAMAEYSPLLLKGQTAEFTSKVGDRIAPPTKSSRIKTNESDESHGL